MKTMSLKTFFRDALSYEKMIPQCLRRGSFIETGFFMHQGVIDEQVFRNTN